MNKSGYCAFEMSRTSSRCAIPANIAVVTNSLPVFATEQQLKR
jgi:hypothetical protein